MRAEARPRWAARKHWLAAGVLGAGLGAAMFVGHGVAAATPDDSERGSRAATGVSRSAATQTTDASSRSRTVERKSTAVHNKPRATITSRQASRTSQRTDAGADDAPRHRLHGTLTSGAEKPEPRAAATRMKSADKLESAPPRRTKPVAKVSEDRAVTETGPVQPMSSAATTTPGADTLIDGRVMVGTVIVDLLRWAGLGVPGEAVRLLPVPVPNVVETWWFGLRRTIYGPPVSSPTPTEPVDPTDPVAEPRLIWQSDFDTLEETQRHWDVQTGRWGYTSGEKQYYTPGTSNAFVDGAGNLVIEVRQETPPDGWEAPYNYTSARVVTYDKAAVEPPVRVTARIKLPYEQGILPAFWTVGLEPGHEFDWPRQGEIDIVELPGMQPDYLRRYWTGTVHGPAQGDNTVDVKLEDTEVDIGVDLSADFHEYGIDWYPDRIIWHVDGVQVGAITQTEYEALGGDWTPFSGAWPHYLILTAAVGNEWTGDPDQTTPDPVQMQIDWVKVWAL
ncbi:family 16 glycosylhydrolase [Mycolicibacterium thermoresistibile]